MSWKVRRASAKCLTVILGSRLEMLTDFYQTISPVLISRFKGERVKGWVESRGWALIRKDG